MILQFNVTLTLPMLFSDNTHFMPFKGTIWYAIQDGRNEDQKPQFCWPETKRFKEEAFLLNNIL